MIRSKQWFTVVRNIIWLTFTGFCLLFTPLEMLAGTLTFNSGSLLPVPPEHGCPPKALTCVTSKGLTEFLPDAELSLPARFLMGSPDGLMPVYYRDRHNGDDDKKLPENSESVQYLKARFEVLTSKNIVVIAPTETGTWQVSRFDLKLADETWGITDNSIFIPKGDVAVLQNDHENLTLTVQFSDDERPANGVIIDSEGIVFKGDNTLWLSEPQDADRNESGHSGNKVSKGTSYSAAATGYGSGKSGGARSSGGAAAGGSGGGDDRDDDRKRRQKPVTLTWLDSDVTIEEVLKDNSRKELITMLSQLASHQSGIARRIVEAILKKNDEAPRHNKLAFKSVNKIVILMSRFGLDRDKALYNLVQDEKNKKR